MGVGAGLGGGLGEQNAKDRIRGHMGSGHHLYSGSDRERVNYRAASAPPAQPLPPPVPPDVSRRP